MKYKRRGLTPPFIFKVAERVGGVIRLSAPASRVATAGMENYQDSEELLLPESLFSGLLAFSSLPPLPSLELLLG